MGYKLLTVSVFIGILLKREIVPYHSVICRFHCGVHGIIVAERSLKRDSFLRNHLSFDQKRSTEF